MAGVGNVIVLPSFTSTSLLMTIVLEAGAFKISEEISSASLPATSTLLGVPPEISPYVLIAVYILPHSTVLFNQVNSSTGFSPFFEISSLMLP